MAKRKPKEPVGCKCVDLVNAELEKNGQMLVSAMALDFDTGNVDVLTPLVRVVWIDKAVRGKKIPSLICTYCPMCGKKLRER